MTENSERDLLQEVQSEVDKLTPEEFKCLKEIFDDPRLIGELWATDYDEVPVSIEEFITNPDYLGSSFTDDEGNSLLYSFWHQRLSELWNSSTPKWELALSGCIGSGKSTVAVVCIAYILHKLLCLKDPAAYYKLTKGSHIALAFFNLSVDQVYSVGFSKLQSYLKASPWFLRHGTLYGRGDNKTYYPDKDIRIVCGSKMEHFIGLDIFCLTGDALVNSENGPIEIRELQNNPMRVYNSKGVLSDFPVHSIETMKTSDLIEIELENGEVIRCTPNHKFMLKDGTFKEAQCLTESDELEEI